MSTQENASQISQAWDKAKSIPEACFRGDHEWGFNMAAGMDTKCRHCGKTLRQACSDLLREIDQVQEGRYN